MFYVILTKDPHLKTYKRQLTQKFKLNDYGVDRMFQNRIRKQENNDFFKIKYFYFEHRRI